LNFSKHFKNESSPNYLNYLIIQLFSFSLFKLKSSFKLSSIFKNEGFPSFYFIYSKSF
jgi:hypothetical protein